MNKSIDKNALRDALAKQGLTQAALAQEIGVTPQAVTNWLKGDDFPRPDKLLKLATTLRLKFDQLVTQCIDDVPVVAFRKKGNAKTTKEHYIHARDMGYLLKPIIPFLPETPTLRHQITAHSLDYAKLQSIALQVREQLGIGDQAILEYEHLIGEFKSCGAILIPVLWGRKDRHENALHILLKRENITFIYINLDTRLEDFKFWMAHELAHVYTPELAGTDEGEDFADAFAGALLFPEVCAENIYREVLNTSENHIISVLKRSSEHYNISINTIYQQVQQYAIAKKIAPLSLPEKTVHAVRNSNPSPLVSEALFDPLPPKPDQYISGCKNIFQSDFFKGLERMINELGTGHSYIQQVLDIPLQDAVGLHQELSR